MVVLLASLLIIVAEPQRRWVWVITAWLLCGSLAAGFYNAYTRWAFVKCQAKQKTSRRFAIIFGYSLTVGILAGPVALAYIVWDMIKRRGWPFGWTLSWKEGDKS